MKIDSLLNHRYEMFSENEKHICHYLSSHLRECSSQSVDEFAYRCHVSKTMLVRFAKKLGFSGWRELKATIKLELLEPNSGVGSLLEHITDSCQKMMDELLKKDLTHFFTLLQNARRVFVFGSGSSQTRVASEMKRIFLPVREMIQLQGHDMCRAICDIASPEDLVILISLSGESESIVSLAQGLRTQSVPAVSITRMTSNTLSGLCGENLYITSTRMAVAPGVEYETTTPYFILVEFLYLSYMNYLSE
ncbi:MAG: MurR/RpiR family transcriptional regulator [Lachnospiraceae bacterium]|jgi:RpiR family glv operon transcriptional regulator|nr:MurR/RpiR family transcriptional regulator [Lachnospiraceae bacterium]MDE6931036.1 MurR/RpiR family transcriptional regulator [Lachnospiraceae bacterium]